MAQLRQMESGEEQDGEKEEKPEGEEEEEPPEEDYFIPTPGTPHTQYNNFTHLCVIFASSVCAEPVEYEDFEEDDDVIDLRAFEVVGGIMDFNLINMPPQPKQADKWTIVQSA